jgi:hypothetical protein
MDQLVATQEERRTHHLGALAMLASALWLLAPGCGGGGGSGGSTPSDTPPAAPTALAATATSSASILLTWTDNAADEAGFELERSLDGAAWTPIATPAANAVAHDDGGLSPSTTYRYRLRATNAAGSSAWTSAATATTAEPLLSINEVDYDQPGEDTGEFIEILNTGTTAVPLADVRLLLVNGAGSVTYLTVPLSGAGPSLAGGQYLVVGTSGVVSTLPPGVLRITIPDVTVQNGVSDGLALVYRTASAVLVDSLSYEGELRAVPIEGFPTTVDLLRGGTVPAAVDSTVLPGSLCRLPDGASFGDTSLDWHLCQVPTPGAPNARGLMINEVDYDQPGTDDAEFVEIYNSSGEDLALGGVGLHLVNGANGSVYHTAYLAESGAATLGAGRYLVVGSASVVNGLPGGVLRVTLPAGISVQNGSPDGMALAWDGASEHVLLDALSYEGAVTAASLPDFPGTPSLVEGPLAPFTLEDVDATVSSICRRPNGMDSDHVTLDWSTCATPTPGAAN